MFIVLRLFKVCVLTRWVVPFAGTVESTNLSPWRSIHQEEVLEEETSFTFCVYIGHKIRKFGFRGDLDGSVEGGAEGTHRTLLWYKVKPT